MAQNETAARWETAEALYRKGFLDKDIAAKIGCSRQAVRLWRGRKGFPSNYAPAKGQDLEVRNQRMMELYQLGLDDGRISKDVHVSRSTVCVWRKKHGLQPNLPKGHPTRAAIRLPTPLPAAAGGFHMTDDEIRANWRRAANRRQQVEILAQLNACSEEKMLAKLDELGVDLKGI